MYICPECNTTWDAPVEKCPECGVTGIEVTPVDPNNEVEIDIEKSFIPDRVPDYELGD